MQKLIAPALITLALSVVLPAGASGPEWHKTNGPYDGAAKIYVHPKNKKLIFGAAYGLFKSEDRGDTWQELPLDIGILPVQKVTSVGFSYTEPETVYCTTDKYLCVSMDLGKTWSKLFNAQDDLELVATDPFDPDRLYLVYHSTRNVITGPLLVGTDRGKTFEDSTLIESVRPRNFHCDENHKGILLLDGNDGGEDFIFIFRNHGKSWKRIRPPKADTRRLILWHCIDPDDEELLYLATSDRSCSDIRYWFTYDDGLTWEVFFSEEGGLKKTEDIEQKLNELFAMVQIGNKYHILSYNLFIDPSDPDVFYQYHYARGVLRTVDGGKTWEEITEGLARATVKYIIPHPTRPGTAFCRTEYRSFMTQDYGEHWKPLAPDEGSPLPCSRSTR